MRAIKFTQRLRVGLLTAVMLAALPVSGMIPCSLVEIEAASDTAAVVSAASQIIYDNEGSYTSVAADDNGAVSIGKLQWHAHRAFTLLQIIVQANDLQAQQLLGEQLYTEITTQANSSWSNRILNAEEVAQVKALLATEESKSAQDTLANRDITSYITHGQRQGITNEAALVYYADIENQGGAKASERVGQVAAGIAGSIEAVTLNELHEASISDSVMGASSFQTRRFNTYKYAVSLGWTYCSPKDSYIPYDYTSASASGAAWIQRSLNTCMKAGLSITGTYDDATKNAVRAFQQAKNLTVDGFAGRTTIVQLIKSVVKGETLTAPTETTSDPANSTDAGTKTGTDTNTGTKTGTDTNTGTKTGTDTNTGTKTGTDTNTGTKTGTDTNTGTKTGTDTNTSTGTKTGTDTNTGTKTGTDTNTGTKTGTDTSGLKKTVLTSSKSSYGANSTDRSLSLSVTSNRTDKPLTYESSDTGVVEVSEKGEVTIVNAGTAKITVRQAATKTYSAGELTLPVSIYSTNPFSYLSQGTNYPAASLYEGRGGMKTADIQWLQAALMDLAGANLTVNGVWTDELTGLVKSYQKACGLDADGIVGAMTKSSISRMLEVKHTSPNIEAKALEKGNKITWKKQADYNRVYIYRKQKGGSYQRIKIIKDTDKLYYLDKKTEKGKTYAYRLKYGVVSGSKKVYSPRSAASTCKSV